MIEAGGTLSPASECDRVLAMAIMIPEAIPPDAPHSEQIVFELLRDDPAADGWVVIHSSEHDTYQGRPREIDFLILMPGVGVVCLEVKGGGFEVENGQWYSLGSGSSVESPISQGRAAMFALKNELERSFWKDLSNSPIPIDFVVVFTDCNWPDDVPRPTRAVIDHDELHNLATRLKGIGLRIRSGGRSSNTSASFSAQTMDRLRKRLTPSFTMDLVTAVGPTLDRIDEHLVRLTEEQYAALDLARDNDRCLFKGAAGTGKTMLALECTRRSVAAGHRVGLLCYNRLLGHWLKQQTSNLDCVIVGAFWDDVMQSLILSSPGSRDFIVESSEVSERELYEQVYPEYARRALQSVGPQLDALIVDEAQDLCQSPYLDLIDMALEGGLAGGRWAMFGDFTNQAIYLSQAADPERNLLRYCEHPARLNLLINCRNTPPIAWDTARLVGSDIPETRLQQVHGPRPGYQYWQDNNELSDLLDAEVQRLLAEDVRIGEIAVLSTSRLVNTGLDATRTYGSYPLLDYSRGQWLALSASDADTSAHLKFSTAQSFKGMESHVIILILDRLDRPIDGPNAYIGMSRARGALTVLANAALQPEIESRVGA